MSPPCVDVFDKQMHHEIAGMLANVKVLQQETSVFTPNIREIVRGPGDGKAEILLELSGQRKVASRNEGLDLDDSQIAHCNAPAWGPLQLEAHIGA